MVGKPVFSCGPEFKSYDLILVTQPLTCNEVTACVIGSCGYYMRYHKVLHVMLLNSIQKALAGHSSYSLIL